MLNLKVKSGCNGGHRVVAATLTYVYLLGTGLKQLGVGPVRLGSQSGDATVASACLRKDSVPDTHP